MLFQEFPVVGDFGQVLFFYIVEGVGKRHIGEAVMVPVSLTVAGDVHQLRPVTLIRKSGRQKVGEILTIFQGVFKGYAAGGGAIIKEEAEIST